MLLSSSSVVAASVGYAELDGKEVGVENRVSGAIEDFRRNQGKSQKEGEGARGESADSGEGQGCSAGHVWPERNR